jgi:circadian clock protein KaiB
MSTQGNGPEQFERALSAPATPIYVLRLYVSGASPKSLDAIRNIKRICDEHLAGRFELEVVDLYQRLDCARRDQIAAAPMLMKQRPLPLRRLIGTLSNTRRVLRALGLLRSDVELADSRQERG